MTTQRKDEMPDEIWVEDDDQSGTRCYYFQPFPDTTGTTKYIRADLVEVNVDSDKPYLITPADTAMEDAPTREDGEVVGALRRSSSTTDGDQQSYCACGDEFTSDAKCINCLTAENSARENATTDGDAEMPNGAIENGREFFRRLTDHYDFQDSGGHKIGDCYEFEQLKLCFETLVTALQSTRKPDDVTVSREALEGVREAIDYSINDMGDDRLGRLRLAFASLDAVLVEGE